MNSFTIELSFIALVGLISFLTLYGGLYQHEETHKVLFLEAGIPSHVEYNLLGGVTYADTNQPIPEYVKVQQGNTEIFSYNILAPTIGIILTIIISSVYLGWKIAEAKE